MKKTIITSIFAATALLFSGCFNPVLSNIRNEVPLEDSTVSGRITTLSLANDGTNDFILAASGYLFYSKIESDNKTNGEWVKATLPAGITEPRFDFKTRSFSGEAVMQTACDATYTYIMTILYNATDSSNELSVKKLYAISNADITSGKNNWTLLSFEPYALFGTNDPVSFKADRKAFVKNKDGAVYRLSGTGTPSLVAEADKKNGAINNGSTVIYTENTACAKNYEKTMFYKSYTDEKNYYIASSPDGITWTPMKKELFSSKDNNVFALTVAHDDLLVGTSQGLKKIKLAADGTLLEESKEWGETNTASTLSSTYEVLTLLKLDPTKAYNEETMFASLDFRGTSGTFANICLWSYKDSRGNWNRE